MDTAARQVALQGEYYTPLQNKPLKTKHAPEKKVLWGPL